MTALGVATMLIPGGAALTGAMAGMRGAATGLRTAGTVAKTLDKVADVTETVATTSKAVKAADAVADTAKVIDKAADAGKTLDKAADVTNALDKAEDVTKAVDKAGDVAKATSKVEKVSETVDTTMDGMDHAQTVVDKVQSQSKYGRNDKMFSGLEASADAGMTGASMAQAQAQAKQFNQDNDATSMVALGSDFSGSRSAAMVLPMGAATPIIPTYGGRAQEDQTAPRAPAVGTQSANTGFLDDSADTVVSQ
jgi:tetrahydromethanopterin S-methyltransferase subunit F